MTGVTAVVVRCGPVDRSTPLPPSRVTRESDITFISFILSTSQAKPLTRPRRPVWTGSTVHTPETINYLGNRQRRPARLPGRRTMPTTPTLGVASPDRTGCPTRKGMAR
jgi:hypothetical protein